MFHTAALRKYREIASEFTIYYDIVHTEGPRDPISFAKISIISQIL